MKSVLALLAVAGAASAQSLADVLAQTNSTTSSLTSLVQGVPGLLETLSNARDITILAPNNDAFSRFTSENGAAIMADPNLVAATLQYHVLNGTFRAADIIGAGTSFPRSLLDNGDYEDVAGTQYVEVVGEAPSTVTVFSGLLRNSTVVTPDVNFTGGVIHVIDSVLTLPANVTTTATTAGLSSLAGALIQTNLLGTVEAAENITVFAPANSAFQNIASVLSNATNETVSSVLTYHVVPGNVIFSTDLARGARVPTLNGGELTVNQEGETFFINGAAIVTPNVLTSNGVVHVIDQVLNPGNATAAPAGGASAGAVQFAGAVAGSEAPLTSGVPVPSSTIGSGSAPTSAGASSSAMASATGAAGKVAAPLAGALAGVAAFLL